MHEHYISRDIINTAKKHGKVKSITIEVGDLAELPAEELEETLKAMVGWEIKIIKKKGKIRCKCGYTGEPKILQKMHDFTLFNCPKCRALQENFEVLEGNEIKLKEVILA